MSSNQDTPSPPSAGSGRPEVPARSGPFVFRCILSAVGSSELDELAEIFTDHGQEVLKGGAIAFNLSTSVDHKFLLIEETYDGVTAREDFERVHSNDGTHWWHERVSVLQNDISAAFWYPVKS